VLVFHDVSPRGYIGAGYSRPATRQPLRRGHIETGVSIHGCHARQSVARLPGS
jgi:hypothetical protein